MQFQFIKRKTNIDILFLLALFAVFMLCSLFIVLFGAKIYQKTVSQMETNFEKRTVVYYFTEKLQKGDLENSVQVATCDGIPVITLLQKTASTSYITYLYHYEGSIREITLSENASFHKEEGTPIIDLPELHFSMNGRLLTFVMEGTDGNETTFYVTTKCKNEKGGQ